MNDKTDPTSPQDESITVTDPKSAPIVFFDGAPNFGNVNGIVNVTLAATRHMLNGSNVDMDIVAVAFLRCNEHGARALRDALDKALLLGQQTEGAAN